MNKSQFKQMIREVIGEMQSVGVPSSFTNQQNNRYFEMKKWDVYHLVGFLEDKSKTDRELRRYYNPNATYDDAYFENLPLSLLKKYGIDKKLLGTISNNTDKYEGALYIHKDPAGNEILSIHGGE
jgi:hypothetical protein